MLEVRQRPRASLTEPLAAWAAVIVVAAGLFWLGRAVDFVQRNMQGAIACMFLVGPYLATRVSKRPFDERAAGLYVGSFGRGARTLGLALGVTWPAFVVGFFLYYGAVCGEHPMALGGLCSRWHGAGGVHWHLPDGFLLLALSQILVVAVPEEVFFRGYLLARFEERFPSRRQLWGAAVGWPLVVTSALFAAGHFLVDFQPGRLAVFFPALAFGWMRSRSGSVASGAVFHALCNLLSEVLHESYL
jgi:membrane protease YdiL (CAAX protease family)